MNFNPYVNPYMTQFPMQYTSQPQQPQQPQAGTSVMYSPSAKDFDKVTVQPGKQALIIAQNEPFIAFKSADGMGMVQTSIYHIEPVTSDQIDENNQKYATKEELAKLQKIVDGMVGTTVQQKKI